MGPHDAAVAHLNSGGVVAFPTDTVTGIGCRADLPEAVSAIFRIKARDPRRPLILFFSSLEEAEGYLGRLSVRTRFMLERLWPGSLTAILPSSRSLVDGVGLSGSVGVRVPDHPVPVGLVRSLGGPLATTSANVSGSDPIRRAEDAYALWGDGVMTIPGESGTVPSTVVDLTDWPPRVLRAGAVSEAELDRLVGSLEEGSGGKTL